MAYMACVLSNLALYLPEREPMRVLCCPREPTVDGVMILPFTSSHIHCTFRISICVQREKYEHMQAN